MSEDWKAPKIEEMDREHEDERLDPEKNPYPIYYLDAASLSDLHGGDICPRCGEPLKYGEEVVSYSGERGTVLELAEKDVSVPLYHPPCRRELTVGKNDSLEDFPD